MLTSPALPLEGLRVLDLGRIYQGPWCGTLLALAGANVVKIEEPAGEPARGLGGGSTIPFAMVNSNKQDITLDLKSDAGRDLFLRLVEKADVVVENFSAGTMDRLGLGAESLLERNPRLVYGGATAFGIDGPDRDRLGMDITVQAYSGVMATTGFPDMPPVKAGVPFIDIMGGSYLYGGIVTALYERERTGQGRIVDVAMIDTVYATFASCLTAYYGDGGFVRDGNGSGGAAIAPYGVYPTRDGFVAIIVMTERHWEELCRAIDRPDLVQDDRFRSHGRRRRNLGALEDLLSDWTRARSRDEVERVLREAKVPSAPVRELQEVVADPHLRERGAIQDVAHPTQGSITVSGSPLRFRGTPPARLEPSPNLGADTEAILEEWLGLGADEVASLAAAGVI